MIRVKDILFNKNIEIFEDVESKALLQLQKLNSCQRVQDDIFRILKSIPSIHLIKFPIKDNNLTAFTIYKKETFIFINSYLPLEKQIYGAAHELYHILYKRNDEKREELLKDIEEPFNGELEEMKANSFAACFLIPKNLLVQELQALELYKNKLELIDIIKLMDVFAVPYKAMILRLYETSVIDDKAAEDFLAVPDREPKKGVLLLINQTRHAIRWQNKTNEEEYSNFIEIAITNYYNHSISMEQLELDFKKVGIKSNLDIFLGEDDISTKETNI